jgi:hypothetical protein
MPTTIAVTKRSPEKRGAKPARVRQSGGIRPLKESRETWLKRMRAAYTPEVCARTLRLNASLPVDDEL